MTPSLGPGLVLQCKNFNYNDIIDFIYVINDYIYCRKILLWLTLAQFYNSCEIEFLPVYVPDAEEKKNPSLFAEHVRQLMAR